MCLLVCQKCCTAFDYVRCFYRDVCIHTKTNPLPQYRTYLCNLNIFSEKNTCYFLNNINYCRLIKRTVLIMTYVLYIIEVNFEYQSGNLVTSFFHFLPLFCTFTFNKSESKLKRFIYADQQDTQSFFMIEFYSSHTLARHVSDLTGPSSGAFVYKLYVLVWYVVIRVLLDTSSR